MQDIYLKLCEILGEDSVLKDEPMKLHTTFKVGGQADFVLLPKSVKALSETIKYLNVIQYPFYIMGNGSNVLVKDSGYKGAIIKLKENFSNIEVDSDNCYIKADAGALLSRIAKCAYDESMTGFEFAAGIPGTLGGAVTMNAGAYGGEMRDIIIEVTVMDKAGNVDVKTNEEMRFDYRHSIVTDEDLIVLSAMMELKAGNKTDIKEMMDDLAFRRRDKQPLEFPSAGSTFKRPEGYFAGKLIMDAGLRGYRVGGAMVSEKHCGFVINAENATASDVLQVISDVKAKVFEQFGVMLEEEVKILG